MRATKITKYFDYNNKTFSLIEKQKKIHRLTIVHLVKIVIIVQLVDLMYHHLIL